LILLLLALINQALQSSGHQIIPVDSNAIGDVVSWTFTAGAAIAAGWKNNSFTPAALIGDKHMKIYKSLATLAKTGVITTADAEAIMAAVSNASQSALARKIIADITDTTKTSAEKAGDALKDVSAAILDTVKSEDTSGSAETKAGIEETPTV
jgi:SPP1 family holin